MPPRRRQTEAAGRRAPARGVYALCCDDSGGEDDALRSVASISGPARALLALERSLRRVLSEAGVEELKWAALRTRAERLAAARRFLDLTVQGLAAGRLRVEVALWRPSRQPPVSRGRADAERLRPLYGRLWRRAVRAWPPGQWSVHPDQRTGMRWPEQAAHLQRALAGRGARVRAVREASSRATACVQLADLLAGLCRVEASAGEAQESRAWRNRRALRAHFAEACAARGFDLAESDGLLQAGHRRLSLRLLRRLPVRP